MTEGLRVLLDAALLAGAGHRHSSHRLLLASQTVPDGRLGAFWRRLGVLHDQLAPDPLKYLSEIERELHVEIPAMIKFIAPVLAQGEYYRLMELSHTKVLTAMRTANRHAAKVSSRDLVQVVERHSLQRLTSSRLETPAFDFWSQSIPDLVKVSHAALMQSHGDDRELDERDLDSLMILGASCAALHTIQECNWCHQWSLPGSTLCVDHALSKHTGADPLLRQRRYRKGQCLQQRFHRRFWEERADEHFARRFRLLRPAHAGDDLRLYVARVLWRVTLPEEQQIAVRLVQILREPHIAAVLGFDVETLTISGVDDFLRQQLEPGQWFPGHWEWKLCKAVQLRLEEHRKILEAEAASVRGLEARLDAALQVAAKHHCHSLTEVAKHLNVDRSTVSQWLRRSSSLKVAQLRRVIATNHFWRPAEPSTT